jgi:hypothetical protein
MKLYLTVDNSTHLTRRAAIEDASDSALEVDAELYVETFAFDQGLMDLRLFGKTQHTHLVSIETTSE